MPLGRVATITRSQTPEAISHEGSQRRLVVQCNVRGRDIGSFVAEAQQRMAAVKMPAGYYLRWGGQFENQSRAMARLALVIPLSLAIIFSLLYVTFRNVRQAALIILNVPFALVGGIAALWIRGLNLNLSASVGLHRAVRRRRAQRRGAGHGGEPVARVGPRPARGDPAGRRRRA